jgi:predicted RNase H-like HicB family nuclease
MKIEMIVERTKTGYSAYAEKYPVYSVGKSLEELKANMLDALNLYFEKQGKIITEKDLKITLDLPQFFEFYKVINVKALSERIGMNQSLLAQYIGGAKKPSPDQTQRILNGVQKIGRELAEVQFLL